VSWDEAFADRYEEWSAEMTADIAFYVELARQANGPLVELAVGNGRVAIPVAQATSQQVIGIDSSPAMLAQARARAAAAGVHLDLRQGDMRGSHSLQTRPDNPRPPPTFAVVSRSPPDLPRPVVRAGGQGVAGSNPAARRSAHS
jgi:SAM-dependent methyltransferase